MAGIRNLTRTEAVERARLLRVTSYDVTLDLTSALGTSALGSAEPGTDQPDAGGGRERTFASRSEIRFSCGEPGATTFVEIAGQVRSAALNGVPLDISAHTPETGLQVPGLAADNVLVVTADCHYSTSGQGIHRSVDPVDGEVYLYSQFETTDAQRAYACFDQPDLKSEFTFHVVVPAHWEVISNMPVARTETGENAAPESKTVHFSRSPRMSTYITAVCAGPYHAVRDHHDGIDLAVYCRRSLAEHLDADDVFTITKQGFDFFHAEFDYRYPLPKYDQVFVPEYNAGAMENFGCVTVAEEHYLFRSQVTTFEYEQRANTILHELAHMWFGDLVTMRWWDDLWLNESFAEWASHWANSQATRFTDAWTTFLSLRKAWGYRQDQMSSTHPVYCEIPDVEAVEVNFDGITYAKGASIIKQLVAYVGRDAFVAGLRAYFRRHAWGNATFEDLLTALEQASGQELRKFAAEWLETEQVNTLRPEITIGPDGRLTSVAVRQEAPADFPTLRTHRLAIGLYDIADDPVAGTRMVRRQRLELAISGERTEIPELVGVPAPDVLLVNDDDLTYCKVRLDERSMASVVNHISGFESSLPRALCWNAAWDMVRDGELATREYARLVLTGLPAERDINLVTVTLRQLSQALSFYADPTWVDEGWRQTAGGSAAAMRAAKPGSGFQLAWTRAFAAAANEAEDIALLHALLDGTTELPGLRVDTGLRWHLLQSLVAKGAAGSADIDAELSRDPTAGGEREATLARALIPTATAKEEAWQFLTTDPDLPNWRQRAILLGFQHPSQVALTEPYRQRYFADVADVWASRDSEVAQLFAILSYPAYQVSEETVEATDRWLAGDHPAALRRLVTEGRDGVLRALRARACDAAAADA